MRRRHAAWTRRLATPAARLTDALHDEQTGLAAGGTGARLAGELVSIATGRAAVVGEPEVGLAALVARVRLGAQRLAGVTAEEADVVVLDPRS